MPDAAVAALASWLLTEGLGAYMLTSLRLRGRRSLPAQPAVSWPIVIGHASLAFTGFSCWISFLASGAAVLAWLAVGLLAVAIGLGVATVTIWTPFPAPGSVEFTPGTDHDTFPAALSDEALTGELVDDLLARMLAEPARKPRTLGWRLAPLVPIAHGIGAITTFLLATLAAIAGAGHG